MRPKFAGRLNKLDIPDPAHPDWIDKLPSQTLMQWTNSSSNIAKHTLANPVVSHTPYHHYPTHSNMMASLSLDMRYYKAQLTSPCALSLITPDSYSSTRSYAPHFQHLIPRFTLWRDNGRNVPSAPHQDDTWVFLKPYSKMTTDPRKSN